MIEQESNLRPPTRVTVDPEGVLLDLIAGKKREYGEYTRITNASLQEAEKRLGLMLRTSERTGAGVHLLDHPRP
jgi:hypothetical protein